MKNLNDISWGLFEKTGDINSYLIYKETPKEQATNTPASMKAGVEVGVSGCCGACN